MINQDEDRVRYISPDQLLREIKVLHKGMAVTTGSYEVLTEGEVRDLDWNHMDQSHRPFVHETYREALRLCVGQDFALSVTKWGKMPIFVTITDVRLKPGLFYQCFCIFSIVYVHSVIQMVAEGPNVRQRIDWYIASHPIFRFLHPFVTPQHPCD